MLDLPSRLLLATAALGGSLLLQAVKDEAPRAGTSVAGLILGDTEGRATYDVAILRHALPSAAIHAAQTFGVYRLASAHPRGRG